LSCGLRDALGLDQGLSLFDVTTGSVRAEREIGAKTNEIPALGPTIAELDLTGPVVTVNALHTQAETARYLVEDKRPTT
jgi:hypothetical protein